MLKLLNYSHNIPDMYGFSGNRGQLEECLSKFGFDGLEMIQGMQQWNAESIPASLIAGLHMRFWPIWLDFWRNDRTELLRQFGDEASYTGFYGGKSRDALIEYYRRELKMACDIGVKYVVFHVSHVQLEHCYDYRFTYSDGEVADAFIEMINELTDGTGAAFDLLLENQWQPGLTFLDNRITEKLMKEIVYPNKGFVLDIGHMMNTNMDLETEKEAVEYILRVLGNMGESAGHIRGIHLNSSLSGGYVKKCISSGAGSNTDETFFNRYLKLLGHISQVDRHIPFTDQSIRRVIDFIRPEYLVYEFLTDSLEQLEQYINIQNCVLNS